MTNGFEKIIAEGQEFEFRLKEKAKRKKKKKAKREIRKAKTIQKAKESAIKFKTGVRKAGKKIRTGAKSAGQEFGQIKLSPSRGLGTTRKRLIGF